MSRILVLAVAAMLAVPVLAQSIYKHVGPDGKVTYSDQPPAGGRNTIVPPPSTGHYVNVQPGGVQAPGTIQQGAVPIAPNQPLPTGDHAERERAEHDPLEHGAGTRLRLDHRPRRAGNGRPELFRPAVRPVGRRAAHRPGRGPAQHQQGERAREAEAVRLNTEQGEAARSAATCRPTCRPAKRRRTGATCRSTCRPTSRPASAGGRAQPVANHIAVSTVLQWISTVSSMSCA